MFTRISKALATVLSHRSSNDAKIGLFQNDRASQAYLQMRPKERPPSADFGLDICNVW